MPDHSQSIYHLVPVGYYHNQPQEQTYRPQTFAQEGFIHCTSDVTVLIKVANVYFSTLEDSLLVLEIDPQRLTSPLKFEAPVTPSDQADGQATHAASAEILFPHIYGPLNREAIVDTFPLQRDGTGRWQLS